MMLLNTSKYNVLAFTVFFLVAVLGDLGFAERETLEQSVSSEDAMHGKRRLRASLSTKGSLVSQSLSFDAFTRDGNWLSEDSASELLGMWSVNDGGIYWSSKAPYPPETPLGEQVVLEETFPDKDIAIGDLEELRITYRDMFPENPVKIRLDMGTSEFSFHLINDPLIPEKPEEMVQTYSEEAEGSALAQKKEIQGREISIGLQKLLDRSYKFRRAIKPPAGPQLRFVKPSRSMQTLEGLDVATAQWQEKSLIYRIERALDLFASPVWQFAQARQGTVLQRRFHKTLQGVEALDFVFGPEVSSEEIKQVTCNFRITHFDPSEASFVVSSLSLNRKIWKTQNSKILRIELGDLVQSYLNEGKAAFLDELIIFYPGETRSFTSARPLKLIKFQSLKNPPKPVRLGTLGINHSRMKKKDFFYLIRRELGLPFDRGWNYFQDGGNAVFKTRIHMDLQPVSSVEMVFRRRAVGNEHLQCRLRIGFTSRPRGSEVVECRPNSGEEILGWEVGWLEDRHVLRVDLEKLKWKFYSEGKKNIYLEELTVYLPGSARKYKAERLLENVHFNGAVEKLSGFEESHVQPEINLAHPLTNSRSMAHVKAIQGLLDNNEISAAKEYLSKFNNEIHGRDKGNIHRMLSEVFSIEEFQGFLDNNKISSAKKYLARFVGRMDQKYADELQRKIADEEELRGEALLQKKKESDERRRALLLKGRASRQQKNRHLGLLPVPSGIKVLSVDKRRWVTDLSTLEQFFPPESRLEKITIFIEPSFPDAPSGLHLVQQKLIKRKRGARRAVAGLGATASREWGGPFLSNLQENKVERVEVDKYFPFNSFSAPDLFRSGQKIQQNVAVKTEKGVSYKTSNTKDGLAYDIIFGSEGGGLALSFPSVGPFQVAKKVHVSAELTGPIEISSPNSKELFEDPRGISFILERGETPELHIHPSKDTVSFSGQIPLQGRIDLRSIKAFGSRSVRLNVGKTIRDLESTRKKDGLLKEFNLVAPDSDGGLKNLQPFERIIFQDQKNKEPSRPHVGGLGIPKFKEVDYMYWIKKKLALPSDEFWRSEVREEGTIFRRRFHKEIFNIKTIDFHVRPEMEAELGNSLNGGEIFCQFFMSSG